MPAAAGEVKWTGRWIASCSSRRTKKKKTRDLELGGGLERVDGGGYVIGNEELEAQLPAKGGRTHCGRPLEARRLW